MEISPLPVQGYFLQVEELRTGEYERESTRSRWIYYQRCSPPQNGSSTCTISPDGIEINHHFQYQRSNSKLNEPSAHALLAEVGRDRIGSSYQQWATSFVEQDKALMLTPR